MIYGKLPIVFLSTIVSEKQGTTNATIASYILSHMDEVKDYGIRDLANATHVAISSISRFCREIGLKDYAELRELLTSEEFYFEETNGDEVLPIYTNSVISSIQTVESSIDMNDIRDLCDDIHQYRSIALFGLLKAASVCMNLQTDLLMIGKQTYSNISYSEQMDYILHASKEDLIIIFSYTGSYFEYQSLRNLEAQLKKPKIWMITSQKKEQYSFIDRYILFDSLKNQTSHPYQLQFISGLIAQEYAKKYK